PSPTRRSSDVPHDVGEQLFLGAHVVVEAGRGELGRFGQLADADAVVALGGEQPHRRFADPGVGGVHSHDRATLSYTPASGSADRSCPLATRSDAVMGKSSTTFQ